MYADDSCTRPGSMTNHAVTAVGYGTTNGTDYWVVRNSWGGKWGLNGYILMKRGVNMCNIEVKAVSVVAG